MKRESKIVKIEKDQNEQKILEERNKTERLAEVARSYYIHGLPQKGIAHRFGYGNASTVTRLLHEARERGVVTFDVDEAFAIAGRDEQGLSRVLRDSFNLNDAD